MKDYQPFPIFNFRTGFDEALEPWLLPRDAYQRMINAHLYRGVIEKIKGYNLYALFTNRNILSISPDGMSKTFTDTLPSLPISSNVTAYGTINVAAHTAETFAYSADASATTITLTGSAGGTATIDLSTGDFSITFNTAPPNTTYSCILIMWDSAPAVKTAIMGIKPYYANSGAQDVLVWDTKRVGKVIANGSLISEAANKCNYVVSELPHDYYEDTIFTGTGAVATYTNTLSGAPFVPGTLMWTEYDSTGVPTGHVVTDNGVGGLISSTAGFVTSGSINYASGAYTITFAANVPNGNYYNSTTGQYGNLFTGGISNFFSVINYQYNAFFTNNVDKIFYYDGTSVHYLPTILSNKKITAGAGVPNNLDITKCLHVFVDRERLLLMSPTVGGILVQNGIYWSTAGAPLNWTNDEQLLASTSEPIRTFAKINTDVIVRFANSEQVFRYTEDAFSPFRWDSTNIIWACDAPYSAINYDTWFSSIGKPAIVGSDGVNVKRADEIIPDFTDPSRVPDQTVAPFLNQESIGQCYGQRFDDIKEGWLCYNSQPTAESSITASDYVLAFNYLDATYATYSFPFSCLGLGRIFNVPTWGNTFVPWEEMEMDWGAWQLTLNSLIDLAGDQYDRVYLLNSGSTQTVSGDATCTPTPILMDVISKNFNPFVEEGQLARLGYVDLLVSANAATKLRVQFFLNDELANNSISNPTGYYQETTLTFVPTDAMSPSQPQTKVWKRIYVGAVGKSHTIRFYQNAADFSSESEAQPVYIHCIVPYFKPAGRIFN